MLAALKRLTQELFAPGLSEDERLRIAEASTKALYVHAHMDEETFDTERIRACPVGVREPGGTNVPSCAYNVLYRERDSRLHEGSPVSPAQARTGTEVDPSLETSAGPGDSWSPAKTSVVTPLWLLHERPHREQREDLHGAGPA